ncbi:DUF1963 domain-containing protein [Virgisporangium aurantiacum]|uniref:DUF1963 domain-containing protein n=1 Tax=Virgisporangium aurantiacum TaxID=175570 RepID=A0A8J3ZHA0_9ACTN|nr:DUF1963 domain-containing protein [Virgisporangium aurantiacum]GIJ63869.1 hypothetical protein Vau01_113850 [Virgisporangium aurantiacum]
MSDDIRARYPAITDDEWAQLVWPTIGLTTDPSAGDPVVGQYGGDPLLPDGMWWPEWEGVGPLSFGVSLDCAALSALDPGFALPTDGTLLFFCHDRQVEPELFVDTSFPGTQAGARVVYVPEGTPVRPQAAPQPLVTHPALPLRAVPDRTVVHVESPYYDALNAGRSDADRADLAQARSDVLDAGRAATHQVGGYPLVGQGDIVSRVVGMKLGRLPYDSPIWTMEADRWVTLLGVNAHIPSTMPWGNLGKVFWLIRREDLAVNDFGEAIMDWSNI